ncbi:MAG: nucleoside kinase [Paludibacteraceae bacterium]|nr:nucleoside kinase [Bacteroidales bacterium]MBQ9100321.1 nucleoside kinase [Paludibacteraceae bacterium]
MGNTVEIFCENTQEKRSYPLGTQLLDIYKDMQLQLKYPAIVAKVNNVTRDLKFKVYNPKRVSFISYDTPSGMRAYVRSLSFILCKAVHELYEGVELRIEHPISKGYYCKLLGLNREVTEQDVEKIKQKMYRTIEQDIPFLMKSVPSDEAINYFESKKAYDVSKLLQSLGQFYTKIYELDGEWDRFLGPLVPSTGYIKIFDIKLYHDGLFLQVPNRTNPDRLEDFFYQEKLFDSFSEYTEWNGIMGLGNIGEMNAIVKQKEKISSIIKVAEALQEKKIIKIADAVCGRGKVKLALIAGPSSSGKTTFSKRLSVQLAINGIHPIPLSMDNYFVPRTQTPRDENGEYDFESIYAVDLELFNKQVNQLMNGEEVEIPYYNFETGEREYRGEKLKLGANGMLVIEGIHALNPMLTEKIDKNKIFRIYVSALTTISVDNHNWIPTTDNRLLRRIIRDYKYRGYSAIETISRWAKVMEGEQKWIFPYQENADMTFNSALIFELCVLKKFVQPLLSNVPENSPVYQEVSRLKNFLNQFSVVHEEEIPLTSLLREFLGGSTFNY